MGDRDEWDVSFSQPQMSERAEMAAYFMKKYLGGWMTIDQAAEMAVTAADALISRLSLPREGPAAQSEPITD